MPQPMLFIAALFLFAPVYVGFGAATAKLLKLPAGLGERGMLGAATLASLAVLWHFFLPIQPTFQLTVSIAGWVLLLLFSRPLKRPLIWLYFIVALLFAGLNAPRYQQLYDTGLYHLQTLLWNVQFPIVPGLANVHNRLGFNSVLYPLSALFHWPAYGWAPTFTVDSILFALVLAAFFEALRDTCAKNALKSASGVYTIAGCILLPLMRASFSDVGSLSADIFLSFLVLYLGLLILQVLEGQTDRLGLVVVFSAFAVTIKLSALPILLGAVVLISLTIRPRSLVFRSATVIASVVMLGLWMLRGLLLSGCALFPVTSTCVTSLPWTVPPDWAREAAESIWAWARDPGEVNLLVLNDWSWLDTWVRVNQRVPLIQTSLWLTLAGLLLAGAGLVLKRSVPWRFWVAPAICLSGVVFWFFNAPDVRFGAGFILSFGMLVFSLGLTPFFPAFNPKLFGAWRFAVLPTLVLFGTIADLHFRQPRFPGWMEFPKAEVWEQLGPFGLRVQVPNRGDQCWDAKLPCTPYIGRAALERLRLPSSATHAGLIADFSAQSSRGFDANGLLAENAVAPSQPAFAGTVELTLRDTRGYQDISGVQILFTSPQGEISPAAGCYLLLSRGPGQLSMGDTSGSTFHSGILGSAEVLSNQRCSVNLAKSSQSGTGDSLKLNLAIQFLPSFGGLKAVYASVHDNFGHRSTLAPIGLWTVPGGAASRTIAVSPDQGSGHSESFVFQISTASGLDNIQGARILFNTEPAASRGCYIQFSRAANSISLATEDGLGVTSATLGSPELLSNRRCVVDPAESSQSVSEGLLTLKLKVLFGTASRGRQDIYAAVLKAGDSNPNPYPERLGTYRVRQIEEFAVRQTNSASGTGNFGWFTFVYSNPAGATDISGAQILFGAPDQPAKSCYVLISPIQIAIPADDGKTYQIAAPGAPVTLDNRQCSVDVSKVRQVAAGNLLLMRLFISFHPALAGKLPILSAMNDNAGKSTGLKLLGEWIVPIS